MSDNKNATQRVGDNDAFHNQQNVHREKIEIATPRLTTLPNGHDQQQFSRQPLVRQ